MPRKKLKVVNRAGDEIKCYTVREAAKELGMTLPEFKLVMYSKNNKYMPYYRLMGKAKKRRVIRLTEEHLELFKTSQNMFGRIANKMIQARKEIVVIKKGMTQAEFGKEIGIDNALLCKIERKKIRVTIKRLDIISKVTGKPLSWFLED